MKKFMTIMMIVGASFLAYSAAIPFRWEVETSRPTKQTVQIFRGETVTLTPRIKNNGNAMDLSSQSVTLYYQTNGMGSAWYSVAGMAGQNGEVSVSFAPEQDVGASEYNFYVECRSSGAGPRMYRAYGVLQMLGSPGLDPSTIVASEYPALISAITDKLLEENTFLTAETDPVWGVEKLNYATKLEVREVQIQVEQRPTYVEANALVAEALAANSFDSKPIRWYRNENNWLEWNGYEVKEYVVTPAHTNYVVSGTITPNAVGVYGNTVTINGKPSWDNGTYALWYSLDFFDGPCYLLGPVYMRGMNVHYWYRAPASEEPTGDYLPNSNYATGTAHVEVEQFYPAVTNVVVPSRYFSNVADVADLFAQCPTQQEIDKAIAEAIAAIEIPDPDLSGLVPYTGAANNLNLGTKTLSCGNTTIANVDGAATVLNVGDRTHGYSSSSYINLLAGTQASEAQMTFINPSAPSTCQSWRFGSDYSGNFAVARLNDVQTEVLACPVLISGLNNNVALGWGLNPEGYGNVLIGTTTDVDSKSKLQVRGTAKCTNITAYQVDPEANPYNNPLFFQPVSGDPNWAYGSYADYNSSEYLMQVSYFDIEDGNRGFRVWDVGHSKQVFKANWNGVRVNVDTTALGYGYPMWFKDDADGGGQFKLTLLSVSGGPLVTGDAILENGLGALLISPNFEGKSLYLNGGAWNKSPADVEVTSAGLTKLKAPVINPNSTPSDPVEGQLYFNSTDKHFYGYNGTSWVRLDNN